MWGLEPLQALMFPFRTKLDNVHTYTIFNDFADIVGIFGVMPKPKDTRTGRIWFIASDLLDKHYIDFLKKNNYIIEENQKSIKWLKWQGFNFVSKPTLVKDVKILYFYKKLQNVTKYGTQPILDEIGPQWTTEII